MKISLIIGSGTSLFSGFPSVYEISKFIEEGKRVGGHTDSNYYLDGYNGYTHQDYLDGKIANNIKLISEIKKSIEDFYRYIGEEHEANYEEIYYAIKQINDSINKEYENPVIIKLIEYLEVSFKDNLSDYCREALSYIESIVWQKLDKSSFVTNQFDVIQEIQGKYQLDNIISLNHDLIINQYLDINGIEYFDGFENQGDTLHVWVGFENFDGKMLKLCKVHGSIDWFQVIKKDELSYKVKIPRNIYAEALENVDSSIQHPDLSRPLLLIGTFNKMIGYLSGLFEELYEELKKSIKNVDIIIVSGYGFGDKGINTRLVYWLNSDVSKKLIVIHPDKENLIKNARGAARRIFNYGYQKVELIEKKFEDVKSGEIDRVISEI